MSLITLAKRDPSRDAGGEQDAVKYALTDFLLLTSVLELTFVKEVDGLPTVMLADPPKDGSASG